MIGSWMRSLGVYRFFHPGSSETLLHSNIHPECYMIHGGHTCAGAWMAVQIFPMTSWNQCKRGRQPVWTTCSWSMLTGVFPVLQHPVSLKVVDFFLYRLLCFWMHWWPSDGYPIICPVAWRSYMCRGLHGYADVPSVIMESIQPRKTTRMDDQFLDHAYRCVSGHLIVIVPDSVIACAACGTNIWLSVIHFL